MAALRHVRFAGMLLRPAAVCALCGVLIFGCASEPPKVTQLSWDGLELVERDGFDEVWLREGASLSAYKRVTLRHAEISFDQNLIPFEDRGPRAGKLDTYKISVEVGKAFHEIMERELRKGAYALVEFPDDDVLRVVPKIVDLYVRPPDAAASESGASVIEMGHMTLVVELRDSMTNAALARVIDRRTESEAERLEVGGGSTSRAAAERIMTEWAVALRSALDRAHSAPPADGHATDRAGNP